MVTGGARPTRRKWRRAKSRRKVQRAAKDPWQKTFERDGSPHGEQPDRLLLSALKYWEIRQDLIEERLAANRSASAAS
jgi:hypothetical protein